MEFSVDNFKQFVICQLSREFENVPAKTIHILVEKSDYTSIDSYDNLPTVVGTLSEVLAVIDEGLVKQQGEVLQVQPAGISEEDEIATQSSRQRDVLSIYRDTLRQISLMGIALPQGRASGSLTLIS